MSLEDRLRALSRNDEAGGCPDPAALVAFVAGDRRPEIVEHLSRCGSCREDALVARGRPASPARSYVWVGVAAAVLFAILLGVALLHEPERMPVAMPPKPLLPKPAPPPPAPPEPVPAPKVEPPAPVPVPVPRPEPPPPKPLPEAPVIAKPPPAPEPPRPEPKPPAPTTIAKIRGAMTAVAGGLSAQADGDAAWQAVKLAQAREFSGSVRLRTDSSGAKARIGNVTYYVRGSSELSVGLEEGATVVRLAKGEAFFDVVPGKDAFVVESGAQRVTVKGTRFLVTGTDVVVQRGRVEVGTVGVAAGERSVGGQAPEKTDVARRLGWLKALDETITIEAEGMALQQGMTLFPDATAAGGRSVGAKGPAAGGAEPSAEVKVKRKQSAPYAVWVRVLWQHGVPPGFRVQVHEAAPWSGKDVGGKPGWQWVKVGTFDLPDDAFRLRLVDPQGGARFDQLLLTSDLDLTP